MRKGTDSGLKGTFSDVKGTESVPYTEFNLSDAYASERGSVSAHTRASPHCRAPVGAADGFAEWWQIYPKKDGKAEALVEYTRTIKAGEATEAELLRGAMREAAKASGKSPRWTKEAVNWLKGKRWTDETPARVEGDAERPRRNGRAQKLTPAEAMARLLGENGMGRLDQHKTDAAGAPH